MTYITTPLLSEQVISVRSNVALQVVATTLVRTALSGCSPLATDIVKSKTSLSVVTVGGIVHPDDSSLAHCSHEE
jgi:hypothetical protein